MTVESGIRNEESVDISSKQYPYTLYKLYFIVNMGYPKILNKTAYLINYVAQQRNSLN